MNITLTESEKQALIVLVDYVIDLTCKDDEVVRNHLVALKNKLQEAQA